MRIQCALHAKCRGGAPQATGVRRQVDEPAAAPRAPLAIPWSSSRTLPPMGHFRHPHAR